jgi:hypothetical protein
MRRWIGIACLFAATAALGPVVVNQTALNQTALGQTALKPGPVPVRGQPYTAERLVTSYQKIADGTTIEHKHTSQEARDAQGRTWSRYEMTGDPLRAGPKQFTTAFYDPDTRTETRWCTCNRYVTLTRFAEPRPLPPEHSPGLQGMDVYLGPSSSQRLKYHAEELPPQEIQGVMTRGSKAVRTIPAGVDGNDHDLTRTVLSWYSPELHLAMTTIIDDPVDGLKRLEFVNLKRVAPSPELFQIPAGYMVRGPQ